MLILKHTISFQHWCAVYCNTLPVHNITLYTHPYTDSNIEQHIKQSEIRLAKECVYFADKYTCTNSCSRHHVYCTMFEALTPVPSSSLMILMYNDLGSINCCWASICLQGNEKQLQSHQNNICNMLLV